MEDKWLMPAPVQDIVPSFTCIPDPSRKIEAPSPSEIDFFLHMIGEKQNKYLELKKRSHEHEKMLFKPIKHKSWHVTVALMSLHVAFFICVEHPFLGTSPDALIECNCYGQGVVEVKCLFG